MSANTGPIQVIPPGLMGMLQLKNGGQLPDTLMGSMQPIIDATEWLLMANRVLASGSVDLNSGNISEMIQTTPPLTVPSKEAWYVWNTSITMVVVATDAFSGPMFVGADQAGIMTIVGASDQLTVPVKGSTQIIRAGFTPRRLYLPGTKFYFGFSGFANASSTSVLVGAIEYTACPL